MNDNQTQEHIAPTPTTAVASPIPKVSAQLSPEPALPAPLPSPYPLKDTPLDQLPVDYDIQTAEIDGCVTVDMVSVKGNEATLKDFSEKATAGQNAFMRYAKFRFDSLTVYDVVYENGVCTMTWYEDDSFERISYTLANMSAFANDPVFHCYSNDLDAAVLDGCVVYDAETKTVHNMDILNDYFINCAAGEAASICFGQYLSTDAYDEKAPKYLYMQRFEFDGEYYTVSTYSNSYIGYGAGTLKPFTLKNGSVILRCERYQHLICEDITYDKYGISHTKRAYYFVHDDAYTYNDIYAGIGIGKPVPHQMIITTDIDQ